MKVLVTGGAGFIGSHLCEALLARGDTVRVLDLLDDAYDPAIKRRNLSADVEFLHGDIRDAATLTAALAGVDAVAHLAARAGVRPSLTDPRLYISVNVDGTAALLEGMRAAGVGRLLFASSSSVYGSRRGVDFREDDPADRPESPYAASKRAAELFCATAHINWGLSVSCARLFTVYGPRQRPEMAIQRFARQLQAGQPVTLFGDGGSLRDYTYVGDAVAGLLAALDRADGFRLVNLAGGRPIPLRTLVETLADVLQKPLHVQYLPEAPGDVPETRADLSVARQWLDYAPAVPLREGLERFVRWLDRGP